MNIEANSYMFISATPILRKIPVLCQHTAQTQELVATCSPTPVSLTPISPTSAQKLKANEEDSI